MLVLEDGLSITLCGENRQEWSDKFVSFFGNATILVGNGVWHNDTTGSIDSEPVVIVTAKLDDITPELTSGFCRLAETYQITEKQDAVYIERLDAGKLTAFIVFASEWQEAARAIDSTNVLLDFFSKKDGEA